MKPATLIWTALFVLGGAALCWRAATAGNGRQYVQAVKVQPKKDGSGWTKYDPAPPSDRGKPGVSLSIPRTLGVWVAALLTLAVFSFLYGDNVYYKFAESVVVGSSAAYAMVVGFWSTIVQNLLGNLSPNWMRWALPGLPAEKKADYLYVFPLILGAMMVWRLAPKGGWISRWPLAFFIGATAGLRLIAHFQADFVDQISSMIVPLVVLDGGSLNVWLSLKNTTTVVGTLACLTYFFFSIEHKGFVGGVSRLGIWFLMITFGAGFGYTVMGRITLLAARFEFLFDDWLWLIDLAGRRQGM